MPVYTFRCDMHDPPVIGDVLRDTYDTQPPPCPDVDCGRPMRRVFTPFGFRASMPAHYNVAAGAYVTSPRDLSEHYKRKSAEDTLRLGMEVRYVPVDPADAQAVAGVDDAMLNKVDGQLTDTHRKHRELGWTERRQMWL